MAISAAVIRQLERSTTSLQNQIVQSRLNIQDSRAVLAAVEQLAVVRLSSRTP